MDVRAYDAGIQNIGNTCFFNALLTCLSSAVPFVDRLQRHYRQHSALGGNALCRRCLLANDLAVLCEPGRGDTFRPDTAATMLEWAPDFVPGDQQCAGETFTLLADALDTEDYNSVVHLVTPARARDVQATTVAAEHFRVAWKQTCRCFTCSATSVVTEHNSGLQLELPPSRATVLELLFEHFRTETLPNFECEACETRGPGELSKTVQRWPPVLFLHVKRFRRDVAGRMRKITEHLFFEEFLESEEFGFTYALQAVAVHQGRFGGGHYVAYVRDSEDQWVHVNDSAPPQVVPFDVVQRKQAYLLVFRLLASR